MPGLVPFVLPALAIVALLVLISKPLRVLLSIKSLHQTATPDVAGLRRLSAARGQEDEYDTLIALGFEPVGVYQEVVRGLSGMSGQYVLVHHQLPITCSLCLVQNGQLFIVMTTDSASGNLIRTSSLHPGVEMDTEDCFARSVDGKNTEQIFVAHVKALDQLESRGLDPVHGKTIDDVKAHYLRSFENPSMQSFLKGAYKNIAVGLTVIATVLPAMLTFVFVMTFRAWLSPESVVQIFSVLSLLVSIAYYCSMNFRKKTKRSTLAPVTKDEESSVKVEKSARGNVTRLSLPLRDSRGARMSAFQPCMMGICIGTFLFLLTFMVNALSFVAAIAIAVCGFGVIGSVVLWGIALGLGHTRYDVELTGDQLRWTERAYFLSWSKRVPVDKVTRVQVELQDSHPGMFYGVFGEHARNKNACVLCLYEDNRKMYPVAPGYSQEVLTSIAQDLGASLGLDSKDIQMQEDIVAFKAPPVPQAMFAEELKSESEYCATSAARTDEALTSEPMSRCEPVPTVLTNAAWRRSVRKYRITFAVCLGVSVLGCMAAGFSPLPVLFASMVLWRIASITKLRKFLPSKTTMGVERGNLVWQRESTFYGKPMFDARVSRIQLENIIRFELIEPESTQKSLLVVLPSKKSDDGLRAFTLADTSLGYDGLEIKQLYQSLQQRLQSHVPMTIEQSKRELAGV